MDTDGVTCLGTRGPAGVGGRQAGPNRRGPQGPLRDEGGKEGPVGDNRRCGVGREKAVGRGEGEEWGRGVREHTGEGGPRDEQGSDGKKKIVFHIYFPIVKVL